MGIVQTYIIDPAVEKAKEEINAWVTAALEVTRDFVLETSSSIALLGGGILVLFRGTGVKGATKWFIIIQLSNILIKALLGEA